MLLISQAIGLFWVASANAEDADTTADVRCLVVALKMGSSQNSTLQNAGYMASLYWLGRLDGRAPKLNLEEAVIAELLKMNEDEFRLEAKRCGTILMARGQAETAMGKDIQRRGEQMMQNTPSPPL
jgi:hypothetical protein